MSLKIGFPHLRPIIRISNVADTQINNKCGLISGFRHNLIYSEDEVSIWYMDFDYGSIFAPDYLFISKLSLSPEVTTISIETSVDDVTYTGVWSTSTIELQGNNDQDYFVSFDPIGPARYWRVSFALSPSAKICLSKIYLGNLFTFDKNFTTDSTKRIVTRDLNRFRTTSGRLYNARSTKRLKVWDLAINLLPTANLVQFLQKAIDIEKRYVVLYDTCESEFFYQQPIWHGIIDNINFETKYENIHNLRFSFREMA